MNQHQHMAQDGNGTQTVTSTNRGDLAVTQAMADVVLIDRVDGVAWVTLNRPQALNAMDGPLMDGLRDALQALAEDRSVRCVGLRGAGRAFCAGGDVKMMADRRSDGPAPVSTGALMDEQHSDLLRRAHSSVLLATMPKPTVAVVHGHVVGGGMSLALACDFRVAARSTRMRVGFATNAISGDFGIAYLLEAAVGPSRALSLMMLDEMLGADAALAEGLVTSLHDDEDLAAAADDLVTRLADGPTLALARMKLNVHAARTLPLANAIEYEALNQRIAAMSADAAEAGRAFAERRPARFTGR